MPERIEQEGLPREKYVWERNGMNSGIVRRLGAARQRRARDSIASMTVHPAATRPDHFAGNRVPATRSGPCNVALFKQAAPSAADLEAVLALPMPSETSLRQLFSLTAAEAKVAQRLACGDSLEETARHLSIKPTTARTQLAAIFAKTETRRQAKLVAILGRVAHLELGLAEHAGRLAASGDRPA